MDGWLKQNTPVTVKIGPFVDTAGAAATGLTLSQADHRLSKNGGNMAQKDETTTSAHDEIGMYDCLLGTVDTDTLGRLEVVVAESGALIQRHTFQVVTAEVWNWIHSTGNPTVALTTQGKADVNAEVVDALATDTYAEPAQGAPAATTTIAAKLNYLYKAWRNKTTNDGTDTKLYNDDGSTVGHKQGVASAGGTVTKDEWISG